MAELSLFWAFAKAMAAIGHGISNGKAFKNMIDLTVKIMIESDFCNKITKFKRIVILKTWNAYPSAFVPRQEY